MPGSVERRKKSHSPEELSWHKVKHSVHPRRSFKRSESRDYTLRAESVGDLASKKKSGEYSVGTQYESKPKTQDKLSVYSNKGCTMFPLDVTDCLKNANDWEAMEIRILDEDKCTVLRPRVSDKQRSDKVVMNPSLYQRDHTIKTSPKSNENASRGSSVLKQTVCVEKVHVRNLLHTKREKCGNLGSSRSSEYMPPEATTLGGTLTADVDSRNYFKTLGTKIELMSTGTHLETCSCHSTDTSDPENRSPQILRTRCETVPSRTTNRSSQVRSGPDRKHVSDNFSSSESENCTDDNDEKSEDESSGSSEDEHDDDDEDEVDGEEEGQDSDHGDEESVESSISDDSYYKKYYKGEENNTQLKNTIKINAGEKQKISKSEDLEDTTPVSQFVFEKSVLGKQVAESKTPSRSAELSSSKFNRLNAASNQATPVSQLIDGRQDSRHSKTYTSDWSVTPTESQKSHVPFYDESVDRPNWMQQGDPVANLNEPSTSLSISEGHKWDTAPRSHHCFSNTQSFSTATSLAARKVSFVPMPEEEIARYKQIALQILTERKQRALEDNQQTNAQPIAPPCVVQVQSRQVTKKKRNRQNRKYNKSTRSKSKDAKAPDMCLNINCRASQRACFWAPWRIKSQIEKHRKRLHSADATTSTMCRARYTHAFPMARGQQKSPKQYVHKDRNSGLEQAGLDFAPFPLGSLRQKIIPLELGKIQSKRPPCQILETLKPKHKNTITDTQVLNAPFKVHKPPTKTHSSIFGSPHLTGKKWLGNNPSTMRTTQSHYFIQPSANTHGGATKASNMGANPLHDVKLRAYNEHGAKLYQTSGKTNIKQPNRICNTGQGKGCAMLAKEKQSELNCESTPMPEKDQGKPQAADTLATELASGSLSKNTIKSEAPSHYKFNIENCYSTNQNLPKKLSLPPLADVEAESAKTSNMTPTATNEHEATSAEDAKESCKPRAYLDLLQNILKSPTAKAAQALGTFLQKPEAQETADRASDITVDQIINSYQKLFDQLYDLSSKNNVSDKSKINENSTQTPESTQKSTDMKTLKDTKLQNTSLAVLKKFSDVSQSLPKSSIIENSEQNSVADNNEVKSDKNVNLYEGIGKETMTSAAGGVDKNKPSGKSKENTKPTLFPAEQETSKLYKNYTVQAGIRSRASSSVGMFRSQGRLQVNHDSRQPRRSVAPEKRSVTENRLMLKQHEYRRSKSSHDSSETTKTACKQFEHTQRKSTLEVRCDRTPYFGGSENNTNQQSRVWGTSCKNTTTAMQNKSATTNQTKRISFSDSSCGIKPKINTFLKTSFSCTRQPAAASRMNLVESSLHRSKQTPKLKNFPEQILMGDKRKCTEQTVTKAAHLGLINTTGTSVQYMTTFHSNPTSSNRFTNKYLVHKECTSSIKAHALVTARASSRSMVTDRNNLAGEVQPFIKDMSIVVRNPLADGETRPSNKSLQMNAQYHQVQEHLNSKRTIKYSTESIGTRRTYPAITIFAPQACLNIMTPVPSATAQNNTVGGQEMGRERQVIKDISSLNSQSPLLMTSESDEVPNDRHIGQFYSNENKKRDEISIKRRQDSMALKLKNARAQMRPFRSALKSNSEHWTHREENCRKTLRDVTTESQKQAHFKRSAFRYGLSSSSLVLTQPHCQREQNTWTLPQPCKKVACTAHSGVFSYTHSDNFKKTTKDKSSVINCTSPSNSRFAKSTDVFRVHTHKCTSLADVDMMSVLPRDSSSRETDTKITTKQHPKNSNGVQKTPTKNIDVLKIRSEEGCPRGDLGCSKIKGTRADRKTSLSWSKQHLTKSQEVKDKYFVNSTALRAIFVTPFPPFHRVDDKQRSDTEAGRRPLAWQKRRCRSAEGFETKNATSRLFTYGKIKPPPDYSSASGASKSLKNEPQLRVSVSNCALCQDAFHGQLFESGPVKLVDPNTDAFMDSKSTSDISKVQHDADAARSSIYMPDKPQDPTINASPCLQETKICDKWNTPPWKQTATEDESEMSEGSSLQAVRKQIVANTCRMIIRESQNLIVNNLQRPTREDSPQKANSANIGCGHELEKMQSQGSCLQTDMNHIISHTKKSTSLAAGLESHTILKVPAEENNGKITEVNTACRHVPRQSIISPTLGTEGPDHKITGIKQYDSPIGTTGEPAKNEAENCCYVPLDSAHHSKTDISLQNTSAFDVEFDQGKEFDNDIKNNGVSSKRASQGKQYQSTHKGIEAHVSDKFPDTDIVDEAERSQQLMKNNTVTPVVTNSKETKQMQFSEQLLRNITLEVIDTTCGKRTIGGCLKQDASESIHIANTFVTENQGIRDPEQSREREVRENTNTDGNSRRKEQNSENSDQEKAGRRNQVLNITEQGSREVGGERWNTRFVNDSKEHQDQDTGEKMNYREHECDEIWKNNIKWQKDGSTEEQHKLQFQTLKDTMQATRNKENGSKDEYKVRQNYQGSKDTTQQKGNANTVNEDVKQKNRKEEHKDNSNDQHFKVLEWENRSTMQDKKEMAKQGVFKGYERIDSWQSSRNVDEKTAYMLQRYKSTEKRVGDMQQDNIREKKQINRAADENAIESHSMEQRRNDTGPKTRDDGMDNKNIEHEDSKLSRTAENEEIEKWRKGRTTERDRAGAIQKSRSLDRNKSDMSRTNKKVEHVKSESSQHSKDIHAETSRWDSRIRRIMSQSRNNDGKHRNTIEQSPDTSGTYTSAQQIREAGQESTNGDLTRGERNAYTTELGKSTRKLAEINKDSQHNKWENTRSEKRDSGEKDKHEIQYVRNETCEHKEMLLESRNERHELGDTHQQERYTTHQLRNSGQDQKGETHQDKDSIVASHEVSGMLLENIDKRHQQADSHLEENYNMQQPRDADIEEKYKMHQPRDADIEETDERREQRGRGLQESDEQTVIDREESSKLHTERNSSLQEKDSRPAEKYVYLTNWPELQEQKHADQEEKGDEYTCTHALLQERNAESEESEFLKGNKNYDTREMELIERRACVKHRNLGITADEDTDTQEHKTKTYLESVDHLHESRCAGNGIFLRQTIQDCNTTDERPGVICQNIGKSVYQMRNIPGKYRRLCKEMEFGQDVQCKARKIGYNGGGKKCVPYPSKDTKSADRKSRSLGYGINETGLECSRGTGQDNTSTGVQDKRRIQSVPNQEHRNINRDQEMADFLQEGYDNLYISRNINQRGSDAAHESKHIEQESAFTVQVPQGSDKSEFEDEESVSFPYKGPGDISEKQVIYCRKSKTDVKSLAIPHELKQNTASVANQTQTEETCLMISTSPRKGVLTRDQQTEIEEILVRLANNGDQKDISETYCLQENQIYTKRGQHSPEKTCIFPNDTITGHRCSPEGLQIFKVSPQCSGELLITQMCTSKLHELQITPQLENQRGRKQFHQGLVTDNCSLRDNSSKTCTNTHVFPMTVPPKTVPSVDSLATTNGRKCLYPGKHSRSCEAVVKIPAGNDKQIDSHMYVSTYSPTKSTRERTWHTDKELFIDNEANIISTNWSTADQRLLENCNITALQRSPLSDTGHRVQDISTGDADGPVIRAIEEATLADTYGWNLLPLCEHKAGYYCRLGSDLSTADVKIVHSYAVGKEYPDFFNMRANDTIEAYTHQQQMKERIDDTLKRHVHYQPRNEILDDTTKVYTHHQQNNEANDDKVNAPTHYQLKDEASDTVNAHTRYRLRHAASEDTIKANAQYRRTNQPNEVEFQVLMSGEHEAVVISQQLQSVGDNSGTNGKQDQTVRCEPSIHVRPMHQYVGSLDVVENTAYVYWNIENKDKETSSVHPAVLQAKHREIDTHREDYLIAHNFTLHSETNYPSDVFKSTMPVTSQNNLAYANAEIVVEPVYSTGHGASFIRHPLMNKPAQPRNQDGTHKSLHVVATIGHDNRGFYSKNLQHNLHSEMPDTPLNNFSTGDLDIDTSAATGSPCYLMDEPKPQIGNLFQSKLSAESLTTSNATVQGFCRCKEKLSEHFQNQGPIFQDLPNNTQTAHAEQNDPLQKKSPNSVSARSIQEILVSMDAINSYEECAHTCQPARKIIDTSAVLHYVEQTPCSCSHSASQSQRATPRLCLLVALDGCTAQVERAGQIPTHVSFHDECHLCRSSNYEETRVANPGSENYENDSQHSLEKFAIDMDHKKRDIIPENKRSLINCNCLEAQENVTEAKPREVSCLYCSSVAMEQGAPMDSPSYSSNDEDIGGPDQVKTTWQENANPVPCSQDTVVMRTTVRAFSKEHVSPHFVDDIKLGQSDSFLKHPFSGQNKDMSHWIEPAGKESSGGTMPTSKKKQPNINYQEKAQLMTQQSLQTKLSQETSTQTLLKQSDFEDPLRLRQSIVIDKQGQVTLLRDSCIGTSDLGTESDVPAADVGSSKIDELGTLDESLSGGPQAPSTIGCLKSLCSPLSSVSSKTVGFIRRVLSRSPEGNNSHIQQKVMENLELFVKSARERNVSASEPRTSPPCKPSSESPASGFQGMLFKDFVIETPEQDTPELKMKSNVLDVVTSLRDIKTQSDCSESIATCSKHSTENAQPSTDNVHPSTDNVHPSTDNVHPSTDNVHPSTDNVYPSIGHVRIVTNVNQQTIQCTTANTSQKQIANLQLWPNSANLLGSTSQNCLSANKLHFWGNTETCSTMPTTSQIQEATKIYQEVNQKTLPGDHHLIHIPRWSLAKFSTFSSHNGDLIHHIMGPSYNSPVANNEISKATLATSSDPTLLICTKGAEIGNVGSKEEEQKAIANVVHIQCKTNEKTGLTLLCKANSTANTASSNTEKSQSASFTRSHTNPFLQSNTNPFMPSAPLLNVPNSELQPQGLDVSKQPGPPPSTRPNPFMDNRALQLTFDVGKSEEDRSRSRSSRKNSPYSSACLFQDETHKLDLLAIEEFMSPFTAVSDNRLESTHPNSGPNTLGKSYPRCLNGEGDLMIFSDASRDTDGEKEGEIKGPIDKRLTPKPSCHLNVVSNGDNKHACNLLKRDRDVSLQITKNRSKGSNGDRASIKPEARKRRKINWNSRNKFEFSKQTESFHKNRTVLTEQSSQACNVEHNNDGIESENKTSAHSVNNSTSENLTSHCMLLKKINGLQKSSTSCVVYDSSEETLDDGVIAVSSSSPSNHCRLSEDHSGDIRLGPSPSLSCCQTPTSDQAANLNILETVTTLTSKFMDICNNLKKNIHTSTGRHSTKHNTSNIGRRTHYYYTPSSKHAYTCRKSRNETKKPYTSQQQLKSCHQDKHCRTVLQKNHSQFHNKNSFKLYNCVGKRKSITTKTYFTAKSPNTVTTAQSDDRASTSISSHQRINCLRRKKRRGKMNDEFSTSPNVYTEYTRLPVCSSNSDSGKLRAVISHTDNNIVNEIRSNVNKTISDIKTYSSPTEEQAAVNTESAKDSAVSNQGILHASNTPCPDNYYSCPNNTPHVFLPNYPQLYLSVQNGDCYVMPSMPFLSTVFSILDDNYEAYLPKQNKRTPKLVLVDDTVDEVGDKVDDEAVIGRAVEADLSATAIQQSSRKQATPLLPMKVGHQQKSDSPDMVTGHRVIKRDSKKRTEASNNDNLCETMKTRNRDFVGYVDVMPLLHNTAIISKDTRTKKDGTCEILGEQIHLAEDLENSWKETDLHKPFRKYRNEPKTDGYDTVVCAKTSNHSEITSSNLDYSIARFSTSGFNSLHGRYYIKEDLSSPPKRRKCDHSNRTPCPAGAFISKPETGRQKSTDCHKLGLRKGRSNAPGGTDFPIPSMTFEKRFRSFRKRPAPYVCHECAGTNSKFLTTIKNNPLKNGGASNTYSYKGCKEYFEHIMGGTSPLSNSTSNCSEKNEMSTELELQVKTKEEKQYHYDDCEPDTYDELGSLCSEMQDTTSKLFQGDAEFPTFKDTIYSYESKSMSLGPTFDALLEKELTVSPHTVSNMATQTIQHVKRCASCSHYFGATLECSKKRVAKSRLITENQICQISTEHVNQFPIEQRCLLPVVQDYQLPSGYLDDSGYKKLAAPIWNVGLITLRSAPVTRSCFTQTERLAPEQESHRPNLVEIRDLMGRCIKSRHFRYYVQNIVDERVRTTMRQNVLCNNGGNRSEKSRAMSVQNRNKKLQQAATDTGTGGVTSARHTVVQTSLPSFKFQDVTNHGERIMTTAKSLLARKSSSNGSTSVKPGSEESNIEVGQRKCKWSRGVERYMTYRTTNRSTTNTKRLDNGIKTENTLPQMANDILQNSKKPLSFNPKQWSNINATNGIASRSFPTLYTDSEECQGGKSIKLWNSVVPVKRCESSAPQINNRTTEHMIDLPPVQKHSSVHIPEENVKSTVLRILKPTTYTNTGDNVRESENTHHHDHQATSSQQDVLTADADCTNNTKLEESILIGNEAVQTAGLHNKPLCHGLCELNEPVKTRLARTNCACFATHDMGAQEMSDVSSSSSTKIDYGRLKNIMSAETKLLWKNLTLLEKSYDRCKRCRRQYESMLGSNKISGECDTKTDKLDTAFDLHSEDFNITRCSNQSTEMADDSSKEKCTPKIEADVLTDIERLNEHSQENMATNVTEQNTHCVFNEVNSPVPLETNNSKRAEHTNAPFLSPVKDSESKCEDQPEVTTKVKNDTFKKPWHVKGKNTAKMIQIFERGNGFFQDNEQQVQSHKGNRKQRECIGNEQGHENINSSQQTHIDLKHAESKRTCNAFQTFTKSLKSTALDDEAKLDCQERTIVSDDSINKIEKSQQVSSNSKSASAVKVSLDKCDVANQHTFASTASMTDAQHILAMNAPNSETDEWIQKLVKILHEMQQAFPQIAGTSVHSAATQGQVDPMQDVTHLPEKSQLSLLHDAIGNAKVLHEASSGVTHEFDLKLQRNAPASTPPLEHSKGTFEHDESHAASTPCFLSQIRSKEARLGLETREFEAKKIEPQVKCKDTKLSDFGRTGEMSDIVTQNSTQESTNTDRVKIVEKSQQRPTPCPWLKSADNRPCLKKNLSTSSPPPSPHNCKDENNQASGSLLPAEHFRCENGHVYDMVVADGEKLHPFQNIPNEPYSATKHTLDSSWRCCYRGACGYQPVFEQEMSTCCDGKDTTNTTSPTRTTDIRQARSCTTRSYSSSSSDWNENKRSRYYNQLKKSDSESQVQSLYEHLCPANNSMWVNGNRLGKSLGLENITQDVFETSFGNKPQLPDSPLAEVPKEAIEFGWLKSCCGEVYKNNRHRNANLQQGNRNNKYGVCCATRNITSRYGTGLHSKLRSPDCNVHERSTDSCKGIASGQLQTGVLYVSNEMDKRVTQKDGQTTVKDFNQKSQWKRYLSERYEQNTHITNRNFSSKIQRYTTLKPVSAESKQSNTQQIGKRGSGISSVQSEEVPGVGESYELTMATMNDVKDTSLTSNKEAFMDDIDTSVFTVNNTQIDVINTYPVQNNKSQSDNTSAPDTVSEFHEPQVPMKRTQDSSHLTTCECLAENRIVDRSRFPWKEQGRHCYNFRKRLAIDTVTYNISAKRPCSKSKRHRSVSPPSVSLKEYISNESETVSKDTSSYLQSTNIMSAKLDSRSQQAIHQQSFDIPIDIYTLPVYRCTSPQKKKKKRVGIRTRTVVISGPVRNMSIAVQRHMRSFDEGDVTNLPTTAHLSSPDLAEGSSPTDRANPEQIAISSYDRKSVPNWRHAMKRMLPFGKRTTSNEKKTHMHLVT